MSAINLTLDLPAVEKVEQILGVIVLSMDPCGTDHGDGRPVPHNHPAICIQTNMEQHPDWPSARVQEKIRQLLSSMTIVNMEPQGKVS
jgi:hypothetical protein